MYSKNKIYPLHVCSWIVIEITTNNSLFNDVIIKGLSGIFSNTSHVYDFPLSVHPSICPSIINWCATMVPIQKTRNLPHKKKLSIEENILIALLVTRNTIPLQLFADFTNILEIPTNSLLFLEFPLTLQWLYGTSLSCRITFLF